MKPKKPRIVPEGERSDFVLPPDPTAPTLSEPRLMPKCLCGCPNHPEAVRCMACNRVLK